MLRISYDEIVKKIKENSNLSDEDILKKVKEKQDKLSGLLSKEGAAHIIANEFGIKIFEDVEERKLKVKDLIGGLRGVELVGRVIVVNEIRDFKKENREGRVGSFLLADETGTVRVVLWDNKNLEHIEKGTLGEGTIVKVKNCYVKSNNNFLEVHLNDRSNLILNPEDVTIGEVKLERDFSRKELKDLKENDNNVGVIGTIVQLFEPRFYEICEECGRRLKQEDGRFKCLEHGFVTLKYAPVLNLFFDDGTDNIRVVAFRDQVKDILKVSDERLLEIKDDPSKFEEVRKEILGEQLMIIGRVNKNDMFNRLEFVAQKVSDIKPEEIIKEVEIEEVDD